MTTNAAHYRCKNIRSHLILSFAFLKFFQLGWPKASQFNSIFFCFLFMMRNAMTHYYLLIFNFFTQQFLFLLILFFIFLWIKISVVWVLHLYFCLIWSFTFGNIFQYFCLIWSLTFIIFLKFDFSDFVLIWSPTYIFIFLIFDVSYVIIWLLA